MLSFLKNHWLIVLVIIIVLVLIILALKYGKTAGALAQINTDKSQSTVLNPYVLSPYAGRSAKKKCPNGSNVYSTTDAKGNITYECQPSL